MRKIDFILVELCMKLTLLSGLKGSTYMYYKYVEKAYNFRIMSETSKWYILYTQVSI